MTVARTIHRFELKFSGHQIIHVPTGAEFISAGMRGESASLWAIVDPALSEDDTVSVGVYLIPTGAPFPTGLEEHHRFLGTLIRAGMLGQPLVFHVFVEDRPVTPKNANRLGAVMWGREQFQAMAAILGVRPDWHEPDEQDVTASVEGKSFDNAGFPVGSIPDHPDAEELTVTFYKDARPVGRVLLATLCAWAGGLND